MDLFGIGTLGSGIANAGASIWNTKKTNEANRDIANVTNQANAKNVYETNQANLRLAREQNEANKEIARLTNQANADIQGSVNSTNRAIAEQNLGFQKDIQDYNKALQQQIFQREDSAYQRTVNDMRNAGLNPLTMNGTNGAGEAIQIGALNNSYTEQGYTATGANMSRAEMKAFQRQAYKMEKINADFNFANILFDLQSKREALKSQQLKNQFDSWNLHFKKENAVLENINNWYESLDKGQKHKYNQYFGLNDSMTPDERNWAIYSKSLNISDSRSDLPPIYSVDDDGNAVGKNFGSYRDYSKGYERGYAIMHAADDILDKVFNALKLSKGK